MTLNGLNLYAYCGNNPVMYADPTGTFWSEIENWFKKVGNGIKDFFVEDVYGGIIEPAVDWISGTAAPAVSNFFTNTIPDFCVNTVWNGGIVPAWQATKNFFTNTVPDFCVNTVWNGGIVPAWQATKNFFTNTVPDFFVNTVYHKGIRVAWNWLNGDKWYQILVKNLCISLITTKISTAIGVLVGGPAGAAVGAAVGFTVSFSVGCIWDFIAVGFNN